MGGWFFTIWVKRYGYLCRAPKKFYATEAEALRALRAFVARFGGAVEGGDA